MSVTVNEPYMVLSPPAASTAPDWFEESSRKYGAIIGVCLISFVVILGCVWYKCFPSRKRRVVRGKDNTVVAVLPADARPETAEIVAAAHAKTQEKEPLLESAENSVEMKPINSAAWLTAPPPRPIMLDPAVEENLKQPKFLRPALASSPTETHDSDDDDDDDEKKSDSDDPDWVPSNLKSLVQ